MMAARNINLWKLLIKVTNLLSVSIKVYPFNKTLFSHVFSLLMEILIKSGALMELENGLAYDYLATVVINIRLIFKIDDNKCQT